MKKHNYFLTLLIGGFIALSSMSCNDNENAKPALKPGAEDKVNPLFTKNLNDLKQSFTVNSTTNSEVTGNQGTVVRFTANSMTKLNGDAITGSVNIELIEIYKKSSMLLTKMPTRGKNSQNEIAMLISGGEFYVNATQGGAPLKVSGVFQIIAPTANTGDADMTMRPFEGIKECDNDSCNVAWKEQDRDIKVGQNQNGGVGGVQSVYQVFQSQFGWTNIDRWYSDPRVKTTIFVDVPEGYDNTNCAVYLSYDGEPTALALFDRYDDATALFTEHYGLIPIGLQVHFIMVTNIADQWYYAIKPATIITNHVETFTELQPITKEALTALIDDLP